MIVETAPAKINLWLHVGRIRADGLHEIESLFVFAEEGDVVSGAPADEIALKIEGPFAPALARFPTESNLVVKAARALKDATGAAGGAAIVLDKRLPIASGVGGGSADAAAALRMLRKLWRIDMPDAALARLAFALGADIPACLFRRPVYVGGAGEEISDGPRLPPLWLCLANPGVETPTGPIFRAFDAENPAPPPLERRRPARLARLGELRDFLAETRNDLEPHAMSRERVIGAARDFLADCAGSFGARMSGSGATVFALFRSQAGAERAARAAAAKGWWSMASRVSAGEGRVEDGGAA